MSIVLVHGNFETSTVWDFLVPHVSSRRVIRLSPPGYGAPVPAGFSATALEFRDWLIGELEAIVGDVGPVHLVGHDWGGIHTANVAMSRPDLLRSWASDTIGMLDPEYEWHAAAKIWQTDGEGESWVKSWLENDLEARTAVFVKHLMDARIAAKLAAAFDATMGETLLRLYRSARQPMLATWGKNLGQAATRPGLALIAAEDHYSGTDDQHSASARRAGARIERLPGVAHWWMTQDPEAGAAALNRFWAQVENTEKSGHPTGQT